MKAEHVIAKLEIKNDIKPDTLNISIEGVADSSVNVRKNYIFVAIHGFHSNGSDYISEAIEKGACLIVGERNIRDLPVPYIQVDNSRKAIGTISSNFYRNPSQKKLMIGITGTNGKTTTSYILKHIIESSGKACSLIGTIQNIVNGQFRKSVNTTPSSLDLHRIIAESNDEVIIVEVSSHGLSQYRIQGIAFDFCLFTNQNSEHRARLFLPLSYLVKKQHCHMENQQTESCKKAIFY
ncbi:hypothetical protein GCM10028868_37400 [Virgibacillus kimchii]